MNELGYFHERSLKRAIFRVGEVEAGAIIPGGALVALGWNAPVVFEHFSYVH
jgi:hypothetical protein